METNLEKGPGRDPFFVLIDSSNIGNKKNGESETNLLNQMQFNSKMEFPTFDAGNVQSI